MKNKILAYGEIMLRLKASSGRIVDSTSFDACYGGTEANVLACLANFGHETSYLTALPATELGQAVINHLHSYNVGTEDVVVRGDTLGMYFVEDGTASRGASVLYLRKHSAFTELTEQDVNYDQVFKGVTLFHVSGISFALSASSRRLAYRLLEEAKKRKVVVSFDFNYRAKLWNVEEAREQFVKAASYADVLLASTLDLATFLQATETDVFSKFNCKYLILRDRKVLNGSQHSVKVKVLRKTDVGVESYLFPETTFDVTEKIGGGDAFDGCMLHALITGCGNLQQATLFGVAGFMLKHQQAGDTFSASEQEVANYAKKLGAKLQ